MLVGCSHLNIAITRVAGRILLVPHQSREWFRVRADNTETLVTAPRCSVEANPLGGRSSSPDGLHIVGGRGRIVSREGQGRSTESEMVGQIRLRGLLSCLSGNRKDVKPVEIHARGTNTINSIYGRDLLYNQIFPQWSHHSADIQFHELFTVYGLFLSDFEFLTPLETELVVFTTIHCLGLGTGPALWHLRGLGRLLGARGTDENKEDVRRAKDMLRNVKVSAMAAVEFVGEEYVQRAKFDTWPNVGDVSRVIGGWGEDD